MTLNVNGKEVCQSAPIYEQGRISGMEFCELKVPLKVGDTVSMSSVYDLSKHPL